MNRPLYIWGAIVLAAVIALAALIATLTEARKANPDRVHGKGYDRDVTTLKQPTDDEILDELDISGPTFTQYDAQHNVLWTVDAAGSLELDHKAETITGTDVAWELVREDQSISIAADTMEFARNGPENVRFEGDVAVKALDQFEFSAPRVVYESGTEKIICEGGVEWMYQGYSASAEKLVYDQRAQKVRMSGGARLTNR
ncbi:MAG TPA: hypothetical protein QGH10_10935 [Armatimonadota bacterium]|nr:hypothetical protein [Armatimonadota bacterium]